ncbi:MAG: hypothetical protein U5L46_00395 [Agrobacterium sp.]|nr:hypothetical protein [Agrobacterium sp.]
MGIFASDVVPFTQACANLSELAEQAALPTLKRSSPRTGRAMSR